MFVESKCLLYGEATHHRKARAIQCASAAPSPAGEQIPGFGLEHRIEVDNPDFGSVSDSTKKREGSRKHSLRLQQRHGLVNNQRGCNSAPIGASRFLRPLVPLVILSHAGEE